MTDSDRKVLMALAECYQEDFGYVCFRQIASLTKIDVKQIRRSCRRLARKGLAQYARGLWDDEGQPAGSGYSCTIAGLTATEGNP